MKGEFWFYVAVVVVVGGALLLLMNNVVNDCHAKGGEIIWTGGLGHLCVGDDGRILR